MVIEGPQVREDNICVINHKLSFQFCMCNRLQPVGPPLINIPNQNGNVMNILQGLSIQRYNQPLPSPCRLVHSVYSQSLSCLPQLLPLSYKLEMVLCDTRSANYRPSLLVLALLNTHLDKWTVFSHISAIQPLLNACKVSNLT